MLPKILFVLTSFSDILSSEGHGVHQTGWYLPEFAHPHEVLASKAHLVIASPKGGAAPLDPLSVAAFNTDPSSAVFLQDDHKLWLNTVPLHQFLGHADEFDALFYVGGHGPMFDLAYDKASIALINEFWAKDKITAAVCHGPAALINATTPTGESILAGRNVTGFSNAEDAIMDMIQFLPFLLEDALSEKGGNYKKSPLPWGVNVEVDGKLITGQNPGSALAVAEAIAEALGLN